MYLTFVLSKMHLMTRTVNDSYTVTFNKNVLQCMTSLTGIESLSTAAILFINKLSNYL